MKRSAGFVRSFLPSAHAGSLCACLIIHCSNASVTRDPPFVSHFHIVSNYKRAFPTMVHAMLVCSLSIALLLLFFHQTTVNGMMRAKTSMGTACICAMQSNEWCAMHTPYGERRRSTKIRTDAAVSKHVHIANMV